MTMLSGHRNYAYMLSRAAVRALYTEVALEPKPGLVSFRDSGSHSDMNAETFVRSLFSLRGYFNRITTAGHDAAAFHVMQTLGQEAEARMLAATAGINTHRGAVFALGLLCASAGRCAALGLVLTPDHLRATLRATWGTALSAHASKARAAPANSNGQRVARQYGLRSAGDEAALAFPTLFEVTLPALTQALAAGVTARAAKVQALFATIAVLDDTNAAHRGGIEGMHFVKASAQSFLRNGGVMQPQWQQRARAVHADFMVRKLSPGGSADLLACACWIQDVKPEQQTKGLTQDRLVQTLPA
jgi:triphosphoribosyl-dephospho-CoA synthase